MKKKLTYQELETKVAFLEEQLEIHSILKNNLLEDAQFLKTLINTIPTPIFFKDTKGIYKSCNDSFSDKILGVSKGNVINKSLFDFPEKIPEELAEIYHEKDQSLLENKSKQFYQSPVKCADGLLRIYSLYKASVFDLQDNVIGIVGVMLDVTELENQKSALKEKSKQLEVYSVTDPLTGLYNRRKFNDVFTCSLASVQRQTRLLNFAIIDVDNFKKFNDSYGHSAGDQALILLSNFLQERVKRGDDYVFRLGGEEFGLLFYSEDASAACKFADNIRLGVESLGIRHEKNNTHNIFTISLGMVSIRDKTKEMHTIYEQADNLLYQVKHGGRNNILSLIV
ncbi:MAG: diguanylate cyclase (GGDEF)-like protein/PAS domain S-box-containing protein [Oleiphilaceae bacterium]|jgi:diguanylate cyclase (GGDEF)-like protein/PAS domain S-box-containing protein